MPRKPLENHNILEDMEEFKKLLGIDQDESEKEEEPSVTEKYEILKEKYQAYLKAEGEEKERLADTVYEYCESTGHDLTRPFLLKEDLEMRRILYETVFMFRRILLDYPKDAPDENYIDISDSLQGYLSHSETMEIIEPYVSYENKDIQAFHSLAGWYALLGDYDTCNKAWINIFELFEKGTKNEDGYVPYFYFMYFTDHMKQQETSAVAHLYKRAFRIMQKKCIEIGASTFDEIYITVRKLGWIYSQQNNTKEFEKMIRQYIKIYHQVKKEDDFYGAWQIRFTLIVYMEMLELFSSMRIEGKSKDRTLDVDWIEKNCPPLKKLHNLYTQELKEFKEAYGEEVEKECEEALENNGYFDKYKVEFLRKSLGLKLVEQDYDKKIEKWDKILTDLKNDESEELDNLLRKFNNFASPLDSCDKEISLLYLKAFRVIRKQYQRMDVEYFHEIYWIITNLAIIYKNNYSFEKIDKLINEYIKIYSHFRNDFQKVEPIEFTLMMYVLMADLCKVGIKFFIDDEDTHVFDDAEEYSEALRSLHTLYDEELERFKKVYGESAVEHASEEILGDYKTAQRMGIDPLRKLVGLKLENL